MVPADIRENACAAAVCYEDWEPNTATTSIRNRLTDKNYQEISKFAQCLLGHSWDWTSSTYPSETDHECCGRGVTSRKTSENVRGKLSPHLYDCIR